MLLRAETEISETFRNSISIFIRHDDRINISFCSLHLPQYAHRYSGKMSNFVKTQTAHDVYWTSNGRHVLFRSGSLYDNSRGKMQFIRSLSRAEVCRYPCNTQEKHVSELASTSAALTCVNGTRSRERIKYFHGKRGREQKK